METEDRQPIAVESLPAKTRHPTATAKLMTACEHANALHATLDEYLAVEDMSVHREELLAMLGKYADGVDRDYPPPGAD